MRKKSKSKSWVQGKVIEFRAYGLHDSDFMVMVREMEGRLGIGEDEAKRLFWVLMISAWDEEGKEPDLSR